MDICFRHPLVKHQWDKRSRVKKDSAPGDTTPAPILCLAGKSSIVSIRRTEIMSQQAVNIRKSPYIDTYIYLEREMTFWFFFFSCPSPVNMPTHDYQCLTTGTAHSYTLPTTVLSYICLFSGDRTHPGPFLPTFKWILPPQPYFFPWHLTSLHLAAAILKTSVITHTPLSYQGPLISRHQPQTGRKWLSLSFVLEQHSSLRRWWQQLHGVSIRSFASPSLVVAGK